jgi:hypothetical protein
MASESTLGFLGLYRAPRQIHQVLVGRIDEQHVASLVAEQRTSRHALARQGRYVLLGRENR